MGPTLLQQPGARLPQVFLMSQSHKHRRTLAAVAGVLGFGFETLQSLLYVDLHHAILRPHLVDVLVFFTVQYRQETLQFR